MKQLQNNFTTLEQSKRLLELGVPADSADMYYKHTMLAPYLFSNGVPFSVYSKVEDIIPCWSVGRLFEIFDMCYQREPEEHITEHWILTQEAIENFGSYIEYLVQTFSVQKKFLNFSKLEN